MSWFQAMYLSGQFVGVMLLIAGIIGMGHAIFKLSAVAGLIYVILVMFGGFTVFFRMISR